MTLCSNGYVEMSLIWRQIYIGFGSMPVHLTTRFDRALNNILEKNYLPDTTRFVVYVGNTTPTAQAKADSNTSADQAKHQLSDVVDPTDLHRWMRNPRVFLTTNSPHSLLFPRCHAIVHHGN